MKSCQCAAAQPFPHQFRLHRVDRGIGPVEKLKIHQTVSIPQKKVQGTIGRAIGGFRAPAGSIKLCKGNLLHRMKGAVCALSQLCQSAVEEIRTSHKNGIGEGGLVAALKKRNRLPPDILPKQRRAAYLKKTGVVGVGCFTGQFLHCQGQRVMIDFINKKGRASNRLGDAFSISMP